MRKEGKEIQNYKEILDANHQSLSSRKENEDEILTGNKRRSRPNGYDQHQEGCDGSNVSSSR